MNQNVRSQKKNYNTVFVNYVIDHNNQGTQQEKITKSPETQEQFFQTDEKISKSTDYSNKIVKIELTDYIQNGNTNQKSLTNYIPTSRKAEIMKQNISPGMQRIQKRKTTQMSQHPGLKNEYQLQQGPEQVHVQQSPNTQESLIQLPTQPNINLIQQNEYNDFSDNQIYKHDAKQQVQLVIKKPIKIIKRIERFKYNNNIVYPPFIVPVKSQLKQVWDVVITVILFWNILYLPWELAFPEDTIPKHNYFLLAVFTMDLIISFRTTYYNHEQDEVIGDREIMINYIKSPYFLLDLLSTIPFDIIDQSKRASSSSIIFLKFLKLIRLLRLTRIISHLKGEDFQVAGTIIKYVFVLLLVLHWEALLWWALVNSDGENIDNVNEANTWLPIIYHVLDNSSSLNANLVAKDMATVGIIPSHVKYLFTLYSMIMLILGGEVTPITAQQGFEATLFTFIGQLTFAIIFANMSKALFQIRLQYQMYSTTMEQFDQLAKQMHLPKSTNEGIREYINFCFHKKIIFTTELHEFNDLSKILQQEISLVINSAIIRDTPLFSELEAYQISQITSKLSTRVLMPNEVVFDIGDIISEMYFINKGVVKMAKPIGNNQIQKYLLSDGEHFGEYGVMQFWRCDYSIKSITFTITHVLKKQVLENIIAVAPAIEYRLYLGQKLYKQEEQNQFINNFKILDIFAGLTDTELTSLYINYMENVIVNPNEIIIVPEELINGLYIILDGKVQIYQENSKLLRVNVNNNNNNFKDIDIFYNSLDDFIYQKIHQHQKVGPFQEIEDRVHFVGDILAGQYFGLIDHCTRRNLKNESYVIMSSQYSVKLGVLNQSIMQVIQEENKELYDKLMPNLSKIDKLFPNIQSLNNLESLKTFDFLPNNTYLLDINGGVGIGEADEEEEENYQEFEDYDTKIIKLREIVNQVQKELKDIQKKLRIVKPPKNNLISHK